LRSAPRLPSNTSDNRAAAFEPSRTEEPTS
jgi:hypothetical protein